MFDKDRVSQLLENSDLALARVGHIPLEVRKQLLLMFDKSLEEHRQRVREACAANPLMLGEHRNPCAILADSRLFYVLVELPCKDAGLSVLDALDVLQFICHHDYYHHFEDKKLLHAVWGHYVNVRQSNSDKASDAALARWKDSERLKDEVRAEYVRDKASYKSKADFARIRHPMLAHEHNDESRNLRLIPEYERFYRDWLKGL